MELRSMVPHRDDALPVESVRDLLGVVRAMYAVYKAYPHRRRVLAKAGEELKRAMALAEAHAPGTPEHRRAWDLAESAIVVIGTQYGHADSLSTVLHGAMHRVREPIAK